MLRPIPQKYFREHPSRPLINNFHHLWCWFVLLSLKRCGNISDLQCLVLFIFMAVSAAKNCESFACMLGGGGGEGSWPVLFTWDQLRSGLSTYDLVYRYGQLYSLFITRHLWFFCLGFIYYIYVFSTYRLFHSSFTPCQVVSHSPIHRFQHYRCHYRQYFPQQQ